MDLPIKKCKTGIQFPATIQPRSSKNELSGLYNRALKIKLTSPPVDGAANRQLIKFLAKFLDISPSRISILAGQTGKQKTMQIEALDETEFLNKIRPVLKIQL